MSRVLFDTLEATNVTNPTTLAAGGTEQIFSNPARVAHWNFLHVVNRDAVDIRLNMDGQTGEGKSWIVQANGGILSIEPEDGIVWRTLDQVNLDGATAEVVGKIDFSIARKEPVDPEEPSLGRVGGRAL